MLRHVSLNNGWPAAACGGARFIYRLKVFIYSIMYIHRGASLGASSWLVWRGFLTRGASPQMMVSMEAFLKNHHIMD